MINMSLLNTCTVPTVTQLDTWEQETIDLYYAFRESNNPISLDVASAIDVIVKFAKDGTSTPGTSLSPIPEIPSGVVDGVNTTFTLDNEGYAQIFVGGIYQHPDEDYEQDGTTIEFTTPPPNGVAIRAVVYATGESGETSGSLILALTGDNLILGLTGDNLILN